MITDKLVVVNITHLPWLLKPPLKKDSAMLFYGWGWVGLKSMVLFRSLIFCQLFQVLKLLCFEDKEVRFSAPNPSKPKKQREFILKIKKFSIYDPFIF